MLKEVIHKRRPQSGGLSRGNP